MSALSSIYGEVRDLPLAAAVTPPDGGRPYRQFICDACGFIYDEAVGDIDSGLAAGTRFEDIPDDWSCPLCGVTKRDFTLYEAPSIEALRARAGSAAPVAQRGGTPGVVIVGGGRAGYSRPLPCR